MPSCMPSTSVRIDVDTHEELERLAARLDLTAGHTVTLAVRALRQERRPSSRPTPTTRHVDVIFPHDVEVIVDILRDVKAHAVPTEVA
jgi:predicted kinase